MKNALTSLIIVTVALLIATTAHAQQQHSCKPVGLVAGQHDGGISVEKLRSACGVSLIYPTCERVQDTYHVKRYSLNVFRRTEILHTKTFYGECTGFDKETLDLFRQLKTGDTLYFDNIKVKGSDRLERTLASIKLYISDKNTSTKNSEQPHRMTRIVAITDSVYDAEKKIMIAYKDTVLARSLVEKARSGKLKAYAPIDFDPNKPLSVAEVNNIFAPISDTAEDFDGSIVKKIQSRNFWYSRLHSFKVLEEWTVNKKTGEPHLEIIAIAPIVYYTNDDRSPMAYKNLFWLDYKDVEEDVTKYKTPRSKHTFTQAVWEDHLKDL